VLVLAGLTIVVGSIVGLIMGDGGLSVATEAS
jgi:hypothetical protein